MMIWVLSAMLYWDVETYDYANYQSKTFETLSECHDFIYWNQVMLAEGLIEKHSQERPLMTFHYFCQNQYIKLEEV